ncbi:MAG: phospholipid carrier-dependent glycosyltransferase [Saprospiraceae bacterium]|nr:phospholipid carrier-dependent glycosyltransferase [Saprospiraceae bacterium]
MAKKKKVIQRKKSNRVKKSTPSKFPRDLAKFWSRDVGLSKPEYSYISWTALGMFVVMALLSINVGLNGDDDVQANYASSLPSFYTSFGNDTSSFTSGPEIKYYGALFELGTGATNQILGFEKTEPAYYQVRHVWNALFGAISIYFMALFIGHLAGFPAALLGMALAFFSMRYLGHSLFNPKDIPFAAGYMVSLYYLFHLLKEMPKPSKKVLIGLTIGIAMSVGVRVGGVLVIAYAGLFLGLHFIYTYGPSAIFSNIQRVKEYAIALLVPSSIGFLISLLVWPYGLIDPLTHVPEAFAAFENFQTAIKVLFAGEMVWSSDIPFRYIITWMMITWPIFSLVGLILLAVFARGILRTYNPVGILFSGFAFAFPIVYVLLQGSVLYDGWRHFLFTYPPIMILITISWFYFLQKFNTKPALKYVSWVILGLTTIDSAIFLVKNSSTPYVYFNPTVGGLKGASGDFELDYWGASIKQAVEWMEKEGIIGMNMQDTVLIATNFSHAAQVYTKKYGDHVQTTYVRWRQRNEKPWDYGIFINRFVDGSFIRGGYWPTSKTIKSIHANATSIAIIEQDDDQHNAYYGDAAVKRKDWDTALQYFTKEVQAHPDSELAWVGLGMAYLNKNQAQLAKHPLEKALQITPENQNGLNFMGYYHYVSGNATEAKRYFTKAGELHSTNHMAHFYMGRIEQQRSSHALALEHMEDCISANPNAPECYQLGADVYRAMGDNVNAQRYQAVVNQLTGR